MEITRHSIKKRQFECDYCHEPVEESRHFGFYQYGFIWNRDVHESPERVLEMCHECKKVFTKKFVEGRDERRAEVERQKAATWEVRYGLIFMERNRQGYGSSVPTATPAMSLNYAAENAPSQRHRYNNADKKQAWRV